MTAFQQAMLILIILIAAYLFFIVFNILFFKKQQKFNFNFRNMFPNELYLYDSKKNPYYFISLAIGSAASIASFSPLTFYYTYAEEATNYTWFIVFIAIVFALTSLSFISLCVIPANYIKIHVTISTIFFCLSLLSSSILAVLFYSFYNNTKEIVPLIFMIIAIVVSLFYLIIIISPKLKYWTNLQKVTNDDGSVVYVRPKYFVLAFSEWLIFFFNILLAILILIFTMIIV